MFTLFGHTFSASEVALAGVGAQWLLSAIAHSLPQPSMQSSSFYLFFSNFIQLCAANFKLVQNQGSIPICPVPVKENFNVKPAAPVIVTPPSV